MQTVKIPRMRNTTVFQQTDLEELTKITTKMKSKNRAGEEGIGNNFP